MWKLNIFTHAQTFKMVRIKIDCVESKSARKFSSFETFVWFTCVYVCLSLVQQFVIFCLCIKFTLQPDFFSLKIYEGTFLAPIHLCTRLGNAHIHFGTGIKCMAMHGSCSKSLTKSKWWLWWWKKLAFKIISIYDELFSAHENMHIDAFLRHLGSFMSHVKRCGLFGIIQFQKFTSTTAVPITELVHSL